MFLRTGLRLLDTGGQGEKTECDDNHSKAGHLSSRNTIFLPTPSRPPRAAFPPGDLFSGTFQFKAPHLCRRGDPGAGELAGLLGRSVGTRQHGFRARDAARVNLPSCSRCTCPLHIPRARRAGALSPPSHSTLARGPTWPIRLLSTGHGRLTPG